VEDLIIATLILIGIAFLIVLLAASYLAWRVYRSDERKIARRIGKLSVGDKFALGRALFADVRVPIWAKLLTIAIVVYLASPIDLLPDFIPVLGYLDDVLIVMAGVGLLLIAVPISVVEEHLRTFEDRKGDDNTVTEGRVH
jgi:uncharacterized membrane protein YkvA (DUF1232 family)